LLALGYEDEAIAFSNWMRERVEQRRSDSDSGPLQIMYRVDGGTDVTEAIVPELEGYRGSSPVRLGNGAADQLQLDVYGEFLHAVHLLDHSGHFLDAAAWRDIAELVDWLCENWDLEEEGIWETRGGARHFVYGRMMAWVAIDRALRIAAHRSFPAPVERWTNVRDLLYDVIHERGWNEELGAFVQYEGSDVLD
jgi:GH15 family glucan-1,4-alpha-glucosidase